VNIEAEKSAIRAVWQRAIEALASCDWEAYSSVWAHEPHVQAIHPATKSWWTGWDEVGPRYRKIIERGIPIRGSTDRMDIHVTPRGDVAWAAMESEVRSGAKGHRLAWQLVIFEKLAGEWRIVLAFDAPRRS
jgi:ketosteroid isomerase-like protein